MQYHAEMSKSGVKIMQFRFMSSYDSRTDWLCFSGSTSRRVTMSRDNILRECGKPVDEETRQAFNAWQREKWNDAAQKMRGDPEKYPPDIAEPILARGPLVALAD